MIVRFCAVLWCVHLCSNTLYTHHHRNEALPNASVTTANTADGVDDAVHVADADDAAVFVSSLTASPDLSRLSFPTIGLIGTTSFPDASKSA